jgi:hypothetical protein
MWLSALFCAFGNMYLQMQYYVGCNEEVRYNKFGVFAGNGLGFDEDKTKSYESLKRM